jgi:2-dehydropantoate 2-reductase
MLWMRILVVGAGGTGGYFGARLARAGRDVTFLLRGERAADVRANGLLLTGQGAEQVVPVPVVTAAEISGPFDLVLLAVRNDALDAAADDIAGAIGPGTLIVPFLNGMLHMDRLNERFGPDAVLGGAVLAARQLGERGEIISIMPAARLTIGAQPGGEQANLTETAATLDVPGFDLVRSEHIIADMWSKWVFIATLAGLTCLMRGTVGEIASTPGGEEIAAAFLAEAAAAAAACGYPLPDGDVRAYSATVTDPRSKLTASLYRDVIAGRPTESDYILDDLVRRARARGIETPLLELAALQLRVHNARAARARMTPGV